MATANLKRRMASLERAYRLAMRDSRPWGLARLLEETAKWRSAHLEEAKFRDEELAKWRLTPDELRWKTEHREEVARSVQTATNESDLKGLLDQVHDEISYIRKRIGCSAK